MPSPFLSAPKVKPMHSKIVLALSVVAAGVAVAAVPGRSATTEQGVYTEAQAAEGATLYQGACAMCHGEKLAGSYEVPALEGRFVAAWSGGSVERLYSYVSESMPLYAPGSLTPEDNAKIVAYMLKANGMPSGSKPLPADGAALKSIMFVPRPASAVR
jgi:mono/diheme cytochrome c family protein